MAHIIYLCEKLIMEFLKTCFQKPVVCDSVCCDAEFTVQPFSAGLIDIKTRAVLNPNSTVVFYNPVRSSITNSLHFLTLSIQLFSLWPFQPLSRVPFSFSWLSTIFSNRFYSLSLALPSVPASSLPLCPPSSLSFTLWSRGPCFAEIQSSFFKSAVPFHSHFVTVQCTHNTRSSLAPALFSLSPQTGEHACQQAHKHLHNCINKSEKQEDTGTQRLN